MLPDVYDMTLNAEVVVLSGCQTALGKDVRGKDRSASHAGPCTLAFRASSRRCGRSTISRRRS